MVNGEGVVGGHKLTRIDEDAIREEVRETVPASACLRSMRDRLAAIV
jgi:hypothetical protein